MADTLFSRLRARRVPQFVGLYLGVSWGLLQFIDWLVKRYLLSSHLVDAVLVALVSLAPAAVLLAYTHGAPGRDRWQRLEKIGIPANLVITTVLLVLLFQGKDLGAASRTVVVTDEAGQRVERVVPKEGARRRAVIFFLDAPEGADDLRWLRYGLPFLLAEDLNQDPFAVITTPFSGWQGSVLSRVRRAGFEDGLGLPTSFMRHLAQEDNLPRFVSGEVRRRGDAWQVELEVFATDGAGEARARQTVSGEDPLTLVDQLTAWLKQELDIHAGGSRLGANLPIADLFSESVPAVKRYVEGKMELLLANDYRAAVEHFEQATSLDPSFALAHLALSDAYLQMTDTAAAKDAVRNALRHEYKLTEVQRFRAKGWKYFLDSEVEKRTALYQMWTELYPGDVEAHTTLANTYLWAGNRIDEAIAAYSRAFELDPSEDWVLRRIAQLLATRGDFAGALEYHRRYGARHPDDHWTEFHLGRTHLRAGRLGKAREHAEKAHMLLSGVVNPALDLAELDLREGRLEEAEARLEEAAAIATTPSQESSVLRSRIRLLRTTGRLREAAARISELAEVERRFRQPLDFAILRMTYADIYVQTGRAEELRRLLEQSAETLEPPFDSFVDLGYLLLSEEKGDLAAIEQYEARVEDFLQRWKRRDLLYLPARARARGHELRGDLAAAAEGYRQALELFGSSISDSFDDTSREVLLTCLGRQHRGLGELDAAEAALEQALRYFPALPQANLEMARLLADRGRPQDGRRYLERARAMLTGADEDFALAVEVRALALL